MAAELAAAIPSFSFDQKMDHIAEPTAKRSRYNDWSEDTTSNETSPSRSEDLHVDTSSPHPCSPTLPSSSTSDEGAVTEDDSNSNPVFDSNNVKQEFNFGLTDSAIEPLTMAISSTTIEHDAKFHSFAEFDAVFEAWKREQLHPFRVASSETLKETNGSVNEQYRYRYVVYHCAHYGEPRMRGIGKRPNQSYLPCGCHAMLRLNYNFNEKALKITTLVTEHTGHSQTPEAFEKVFAKIKSSPSGSPVGRVKRERTSSSSPFSVRNSPGTSASSSQQASPLLNHTHNSAFNLHNVMQHQQIMAAIMSQQKENINQLTAQHLQMALGGIARPIPQNPLQNQMNPMFNMLNMMNFMQPVHGMVAPPNPVADEPKPASVSDHVDVVNEFALPSGLPAPVPIRHVISPPPVLEAQAPIAARSEPAPIPVSVPVDPIASLIELSNTTIHSQLRDLLTSLSTSCTGISDQEAVTRIQQLKQIADQWNTTSAI